LLKASSDDGLLSLQAAMEAQSSSEEWLLIKMETWGATLILDATVCIDAGAWRVISIAGECATK